MSKVVDNRVVEMRFDNKQFESAVRTTMSTLDKLKQSLKLDKASKGLENINTAAKNVNMSGLARGVETVHARFSALQVIGVTALANIANSAINAGKQLVSSLTIAPVMDGFREYETQLGSIQTILANTESKGSTLGEVNAALAELNKYADQTIYNFSEMTRNIGTFTAAGVDLDTAVTSIKGIANLAAVSGSSAQQASVAMYQLSQAIAAGKVSLMDWNSVVNAGMGGEVFQNALKRTAENFGTNVDGMIAKYGSFRESLTKGEWLTTEVLTETLTQLSGAYTEADLIAQGYTEQQAKDIVKLAETASNAATKVKSFSQLMDTMREAVGSGWSQTWQIIFGDFEEAKDLFTGISEALSGFINKMSDARNEFLSTGLSSGWKQFLKQGINDEEAFRDTVKLVAKDHGVAIDEMINKNGSFDKSLKEGWMTTDILTESLDKFVGKVEGMSAEQLKEAGYTQDQVEALKNLKKSVDDGSISLEDFSKKMNQLSGRENIIEGFKNIFDGIGSVINPIKEALGEIFEPLSGDVLYNATAAFREFTSHLKIGEKTANKLKRTFKGLFAVIDVVATVIGNGLSFGLKLVCGLFSNLFDITGHGVDGFLGLTAAIGDLLVKFQEWALGNNIIVRSFKFLVGSVKSGINQVKEWIKAFSELPQVQAIVGKVGKAMKDLSGFATELVDNVKNGTMSVVDAIGTFASKLGKTAKDIFDSIVENVNSFIDTIQNSFSKAGSKFAEIVETIGDALSKIDFRPIAAIIASLAMFVLIRKLASALSILAAPLEAVTEAADKFGGVLDSLKKRIKAKNMSVRAKAILDIAKAIAILVGSIALLTALDTGKVWGSVAVIGALIGMIAALTVVSGKFGPENALEFGKLSLALFGISGALLILSLALKNIQKLDPDKAIDTFVALGVMVGSLAAVLATFGKFVNGKAAMNIGKVGSTFLKLAAALVLITMIMKMISSMNPGDISKGLAVITAFSMIMVGLTAMSRFGDKNASKVGSMLMKISAAMGMMTIVVKMISGLEPGEIIKGTLVISLFGGILTGLTAMTRLAGKSNVAKIGSTIFSISSAIGMLVIVTKMISGLEPGEIFKGALAISAFGGIVVGLVALTRLIKGDAVKMAGTIIALSTAIGVLAGVSIVLSLIDLDGLKKGVTAVSILSTMMALMVYATKGASDCKGNLIVLSVAVALLAGAAATLSLIDESKLRNASLAISAMMATFALIVKSTEYAKKSMGTLLTITLVVGLLSGVLALISGLPADSTLPNAIGLSVLMTAISGAMLITSKAGELSLKAIGSLAAMIAVVGGLAAIVGVLASMKVGSTLEIAASLSLLLLSLSASLVILNGAALIAPNALLAMGAMTLITGGLAAIIGVLASMKVGSTLEIAKSLSMLVMTLSGACAILAVVGLGGPAAIVGIGSLVTLVGAMGGLMLALGGLVTYIPDAKKFLDEGISVLEQISNGLGSIAGNLVGGFLEGAASGIPEVGKKLTEFMDNIKPFIDGANSIDESAMTGVKMLAETIMILTGAGLVDQLTSFISGGSSLSSFAEQLVPFGKAMQEYSNAVSGINAEAITSSATAAKGLAEVANAIPTEGGLWGILAGEKDLGQFGRTLVPFGKAMKDYGAAVAGVDTGAITASVEAASGIVEVANSIPLEGGLWGLLAGEKNLGQFGSTLVPFGMAMRMYAASVSGIDTGAITSSAAAAKGIVEVAKTIPPEGGLWSLLAGEQDLSAFGKKLVPFGKAMKKYAAAVVGIDTASIESSVASAKAMVKVVKAIPGEGVLEKLGELITGGNDPSAMIEDLVPFGQAMRKYANSVIGIDTASISSSVASVKSTIKVAKLINGAEISEGDGSLMSATSSLVPFGTAMRRYSMSVSGLDLASISTSVSAAKQLVKLINGMSDIDTSGVGSFVTAVNTLGTASVASFVSAFQNASAQLGGIGLIMMNNLASGIRSGTGIVIAAASQVVYSAANAITSRIGSFMTAGMSVANGLLTGINSRRAIIISSINSMLTASVAMIRLFNPSFTAAGELLVLSLISGIKSNSSNVGTSITDSLSNAVNTIRDYYDDFYSAGGYLVQGFADGISENTYKSTAKASAMAKEAKIAAEKELDEHSPSKVFKKIGKFVPEGFAIGIDSLGSRVENSAKNMAGTAIDTASKALSTIASITNGDLDVAPRIRPVVDLTNVGSTVKDISLGANIDASLTRPIDSLSRLVYDAQAEIAASNREVIGAINDLREDLNMLYSGDDQELALYVDSKKLASSLVKPMNRQLSILARRGV